MDDFDSTPESGSTRTTWNTRVDCSGTDGMDGVPIRNGEKYKIWIEFIGATRCRCKIFIYPGIGYYQLVIDTPSCESSSQDTRYLVTISRCIFQSIPS